MPNEKVSFLKPIEEIKEKFVYVKDKDYLGFESASSPTLQFNLHKMKKFDDGSENGSWDPDVRTESGHPD